MMRDPQKGQSIRERLRAPLVGRQAEMAILDHARESVEQVGQSRIVSVIGPAGIGKTRLIEELIETRPADGGVLGRVYHGSARDLPATYGVFAQMFRARFGLAGDLDPVAMKARMHAEVALVLEDHKVDDVLYFLGQLLDLPFAESPLTRAVGDDPQQARLVRRSVVKAFLEADALREPMTLVFEDLHYAHADSLSLLNYLLEYVSAPILFLCAARSGLSVGDEEWGRVGEERHTVIELQPLREEGAASMMTSLLEGCLGGAPPKLIEAACTFAKGNPRLLEQMMRIYLDEGVLKDEALPGEEPAYRVDLDKLQTVRLPLTLEDAVNARLEALGPYDRDLLERAAVVGTVFWSRGLIALGRTGEESPSFWENGGETEDAARITTQLEGLVHRGYIVKLAQSTFPGQTEYAFTHNKEREALEWKVSSSLARQFHQVIADWMDHQPVPRDNEQFVAMIGEHREKGGDLIRAGLAFLEAGDLAHRHYATGRASEYYQKGLVLLGDSHAGRRIDALHDYGDVLERAGFIDDAFAAFREMLTLAYRLDMRHKGGAAHNRIGRLYREIGSLDEAGTHLTTAMALFESAHDERGVASSIDDIGKLSWMKGEYDTALQALQEGLARRQKIGDRRSIALSLNNLGLVLQDSGEFREALDAFEESLAIRREIGDLVGVVVSLNNLGTIAQDQRDFSAALRFFEDALAVAQQIGDRNRTALVLTNIGETHYRSGNPDRAIDVLRGAEELCDELGDRLGLAEALRGLGKAYLLQGDLPKARDCISRAVDLFAAVRSNVHLGIALRTLGEITAAGGWGKAHTKSARGYFIRAVSIFEQNGNEVELARTYKVFSRFLTTDPECTGDQAARAQAERMNAAADGIFDRLKISSFGVLAADEPPESRQPQLGELSSP
jgi:tetratricopeptide (TPR) repeat protein